MNAKTLRPWSLRDLGDDVRRGAEAVQPEPLGVARHPQRAVADQAGAEERRGLEILVTLGDGEAEPLVRDDALGVAAVQVVSGEAGLVAQVLTAGAAVAAGAVRPPEPRHADARARHESLSATLDRADDLVPDDERELRIGKLAVDDVQVGPADPADVHTDEHLSRAGLRLGELSRAQRAPRRFQQHGAHDASV